MQNPDIPIMTVNSRDPRCCVCGECTRDPQSDGFRVVGSEVFCGETCSRTRAAKHSARGIDQRISNHYLRNASVEGEDIFGVFEKERAVIVGLLRSLADDYERLPPVRAEREATGDKLAAFALGGSEIITTRELERISQQNRNETD